MKAIDIANLSKRYAQDKIAVNQINFSIERGEVFGFLGPNGAGKTTTVKLLIGMLTPSGGGCSVFGINPFERPEEIHKLSGVITERAQMYDGLTGYQNLIFYGDLFGLDASESKARAQDLLERLGLTDAKDKKLSAYSTGMRQRLSLARAMINRPKILFLDEPTSGLDPESVLDVNTLIKQLAVESGTTVFLCTHQLRYAQEICTSYGLISEGSMLACGSLEDLRAKTFSTMTVTVRADRFPDDIRRKRNEDGSCDVEVISDQDIADLVKRIVTSGGNVFHVAKRIRSLEEIYFTLTRQKANLEGTV